MKSLFLLFFLVFSFFSYCLEPFQKRLIEDCRNASEYNTKILESDEPFITGYTFRSIARFKLDGDIYSFNPEEVECGDFIFVYGSRITPFLKEIHKKIKNPYFLISTFSDDPTFTEEQLPYLEDPKILAIASMNNETPKHPKSIPLPLGKPTRLRKVGAILPEHYLKCFENMPPKQILAFCSFNLHTSPVRITIYNTLKNKDFITAGSHFEPDEYARLLAGSLFCISPRGTGLDCFRHWESLWFNTIPVVEKSVLDGLFFRLPVLIVEDLHKITKSDLLNYYEWVKENKSTFHYEKLFAEYWLSFLRKLQNLAKNNSSVGREIQAFKKVTYGY